jgi:hypothetical protein
MNKKLIGEIIGWPVVGIAAYLLFFKGLTAINLFILLMGAGAILLKFSCRQNDSRCSKGNCFLGFAFCTPINKPQKRELLLQEVPFISIIIFYHLKHTRQ